MSILWFSSQLFAISVADLPSMVRKANKDVLAADQDAHAADASRKAAYAPYFPKIEWKSTYTRLDKDIEIDIPKQRIEKQIGNIEIGIDVDPPPVTVQDKDIFNSHLLLTQPLYAGGRISAGLDAATAQAEEAKLNYENSYDEKLSEALNRYFKVKLAHAVVQILKQIDLDLDRLETIANSLVKTGMAAKFSTLQIKVAKSDLKARLLEAEAKEKVAMLALKSTVGVGLTSTVGLDSDLVRLPLNEGLDVFKVQSLNKRREFLILESKHKQIDALKSATTGAMLPTVYAFGKRELIKEELTMLQPLWAVGVGIDIPLTAGISQVPERMRAAELGQKVELLKEKAQLEIPIQVESIYASCLAAAGGLDALDDGLGMAKETLRLAEIRFKSGTGSSVESLKAATDYETVQVKKLQLLEEYNRQLIELYRAAGNTSDYISAYLAGTVELGKTPGRKI